MPAAEWNITELCIDNYVGKINNRTEIINPTVSHIREAIQSLNGGNCSSLCFTGADESVFCVGGGPDRFHESVTFSNAVYILCNPNNGSEPVQLIIGSILTPLPSQYIVDQQTALRAAEYFYRNGTLDPDLHWTE
jgi:hypothetical protein